MCGAKSGFLLRQGALCAALAFASAPAFAQNVSSDAQIAIVTPLSFISVEDLEFGSVIPSATAGRVTVSVSGVRTATNGIVLVGNGHQAARFAGMGSQNQRLRIRITPNAIALTGPGPSMTVDNFVIGPAPSLQPAGASPNFRIIPADGIFWFTVGARLTVGANQPAGTYSGTFSATLDYL